MASNIEIQEEDGDEEEDDEVYGNVGTKTRTARHKHPRKKTRPVRRGRRYRLVVLGLGLLCGVQALLNIGLRLSLYSDWTEEKNNLLKHLEQLQSSYNDVTAEKDHIQSKYNNLANDLDNVTAQKDQIQSSYDQLQSSYNIMTAERDELKRRLCESPGWQRFGCSSYYISTEVKTWDLSRQYCRDNQADLIIINSKEEQDFVNKQFGRKQTMWLGLTDREKKGVWKWVDGKPLTSPTYWSTAYGQPDDRGGGEDCAVYQSGYGWHDYPCTDAYRWMCEKAL